jgi:hypothetical protein
MRIAPLALFAAAVLAPTAQVPAGAPAAPQATDQSTADLRQEIDRLRRQLADSQAELDAAKARIKELEAKLAAAAAGGARGGEIPAPPPPPVPADPTVGPGGLLASLQADYLAAFPDDPPPRSAQRLFDQHLQALRAFATRANRDYVRQVTWTGQLDPNIPPRVNARQVGFTMVFRNGAREFRVPATVSQGTFERIVTNGRPTDGPIAVTAIVTPRVRVNAERPDRGAFESIPMVAPYVEFLYDLDVKSVMPAPPADATVPANPGAPAGNAPAR